MSEFEFCASISSHKKQTNPVALSPQANYTDWATATCISGHNSISKHITFEAYVVAGDLRR
jgi:hypothetical protein